MKTTKSCQSNKSDVLKIVNNKTQNIVDCKNCVFSRVSKSVNKPQSTYVSSHNIMDFTESQITSDNKSIGDNYISSNISCPPILSNNDNISQRNKVNHIQSNFVSMQTPIPSNNENINNHNEVNQVQNNFVSMQTPILSNNENINNHNEVNQVQKNFVSMQTPILSNIVEILKLDTRLSLLVLNVKYLVQFFSPLLLKTLMLVYFINYNPKLHLCVLGLLVYLLCVSIQVKGFLSKKSKYLIANKCKKSYLGKPFKSSKVKFKFSNIGRFY